MSMRLGSKAEGDDFFDRETEREDLWRHLEANHVVLSGPRRLGKTSIFQSKPLRSRLRSGKAAMPTRDRSAMRSCWV